MNLIPVYIMLMTQITPTVQIISKIDSIGLGKHYDPWIQRVKLGDPWALSDLVLECSKQRIHRQVNLGELSSLAIPQLQQMCASDPGKAYYYLAEMIHIVHGPIDDTDYQLEYINLLEKSSSHGYAFADLKLYRDCLHNNLYFIKSPHWKSKAERLAIQAANPGWGGRKPQNKSDKPKGGEVSPGKQWMLQQADRFRRRAVEGLIPLAREGNAQASIELYILVSGPTRDEIQTKFDALCPPSQAILWVREAATKGSTEARKYLTQIRTKSGGLETFQENSPEFQECVELAGKYDPSSIQDLVDYYREKKDWVNARYWATKGREALGQSNRFLDSAWEEDAPPK
jgi:hypothetical protein